MAKRLRYCPSNVAFPSLVYLLLHFPNGQIYPRSLQRWVMVYAGIVLLVSGLVLWFPEIIPWSMRWLRYTAILLHVSAALVTIGAFIIHVYMGTALVRGSFTAIVRGEVSPAWAKEHHRLWYEEVTRK